MYQNLPSPLFGVLVFCLFIGGLVAFVCLGVVCLCSFICIIIFKIGNDAMQR